MSAKTHNQTDEMRGDHKPLYPMQNELSVEEKLRLKSGLSIWLISMSVPIVLLFEVRYVFAGGRVGPEANPWLGLIGLVVMIIAGLILQNVNQKTTTGDRRGIVRQYGWALLFGLAALILNGWQIANHSMNTTDHYDDMLLIATGVGEFYILCALIAILAARGRVKRIANELKNYWGVHATAIFWWYVSIVWLAVYVLIYWL